MRRFSLTNLVDKLANVLDSTILQKTRDYIEYNDKVFIYHYYLSIIFKKFNQAECNTTAT